MNRQQKDYMDTIDGIKIELQSIRRKIRSFEKKRKKLVVKKKHLQRKLVNKMENKIKDSGTQSKSGTHRT